MGFDDSVTTDAIGELVEIGVVGRPHGVDGKIRIYLHNPESTAFENTSRLYFDQKAGFTRRVIADVRAGSHPVLVRLEGCQNRTQAEKLKDAKVFVRREDLPKVASDEFYVADIIGLEAWVDDTLLGNIASSRPQGTIEVVTVRGDGFEMEIPLVENFVVKLDIPEGRILFRDVDTLPRSTVSSYT